MLPHDEIMIKKLSIAFEKMLISKIEDNLQEFEENIVICENLCGCEAVALCLNCDACLDYDFFPAFFWTWNLEKLPNIMPNIVCKLGIMQKMQT